MPFRIIKFLLLVLLACGLSCCSSSCGEPSKADLKTYFPASTLIYLETDDLSKVSGVFTGNRDWRALSGDNGGGGAYLAFLQNKQAALAVIGFQNSEEGAILQVRPDLALVIDTQSSQSQASATAEKILRALSRRFSGEDAGVEKQTIDGAEWLTAAGSEGKKIYAAVPGASGAVIVIANSENALKRCLEVKRGSGESLTGSRELLLARQQHSAADSIAFGYVSSAGIKELSNYLSVSYALKSSENSLTREMISGILPEIMQKAVGSIAWSAKAVNFEGGVGVEDTYFIKTNKEFADTVFQTVKVSPSEGPCDSPYLPWHVYSVTCYRLENPQLAWRGAVLSLAKQLDPRAVGLFNEFSHQLLKPYGIDDPELFLSAIGPQIVIVRFDADGNSAAAIVKVKDKDAIRRAIAAKEPREFPNADFWKSQDGEFAALFAGKDDLIIGNFDAVTKCPTEMKFDRSARPKLFGDFSPPGAVAVTVQKDDSRSKILAAVNTQNVEETSYAFIETRIGPDGITRRSISAFGLFGEIFRQAVE